MKIVEMISGQLYASGALDHYDWKIIKEKQITVIINLSTKKDNPPKGFSKNRLVWMPLSMMQAPSMHWLFRVTDTIFRLINEGHRVLIHCNLGKHRTGLVITAYYMRRYQLKPESALAKARRVKPDLNPPFHFMAALYQFDKHLRKYKYQ